MAVGGCRVGTRVVCNGDLLPQSCSSNSMRRTNEEAVFNVGANLDTRIEPRNGAKNASVKG